MYLYRHPRETRENKVRRILLKYGHLQILRGRDLQLTRISLIKIVIDTWFLDCGWSYHQRVGKAYFQV